jgi:hypothetical protein
MARQCIVSLPSAAQEEGVRMEIGDIALAAPTLGDLEA